MGQYEQELYSHWSTESYFNEYVLPLLHVKTEFVNILQIQKSHMVAVDRRLKVLEVVRATGLSHGSGVLILNDQLDKTGLSAQRNKRFLTIDYKRTRMSTSK